MESIPREIMDKHGEVTLAIDTMAIKFLSWLLLQETYTFGTKLICNKTKYNHDVHRTIEK